MNLKNSTNQLLQKLMSNYCYFFAYRTVTLHLMESSTSKQGSTTGRQSLSAPDKPING